MQADCTLCRPLTGLSECSLSPDRLHPGAVEATANLKSYGVTGRCPRCRHRIETISACGTSSRRPLPGATRLIHPNHFIMRSRTNAILRSFSLQRPCPLGFPRKDAKEEDPMSQCETSRCWRGSH